MKTNLAERVERSVARRSEAVLAWCPEERWKSILVFSPIIAAMFIVLAVRTIVELVTYPLRRANWQKLALDQKRRKKAGRLALYKYRR